MAGKKTEGSGTRPQFESKISQKLGEDFAKFCGLLRIYELYNWQPRAHQNFDPDLAPIF